MESLRWRNSKLVQIAKGGQQHARKPHGGIGGQGRICKTKRTKRKRWTKRLKKMKDGGNNKEEPLGM